MDAMNFVKDYVRMCRTINYCKQCPLKDTGFCGLLVKPLSQKNAEEVVRRVEEWATAHPIKTLQDVFLKQWPETKVTDDGILIICPMTISAEYRADQGGCATPHRSCAECRRGFWMQEVED